VLVQIIDGDMKEIQKIATDFTDNDKVDLAIIGNNGGKLVVSASQIAIDNDIKAGDIIKEITKILGGGGGGKPTLAQGATSKIDDENIILDIIRNLLN
jgi:alanyl-tRNA synthetase